LLKGFYSGNQEVTVRIFFISNCFSNVFFNNVNTKYVDKTKDLSLCHKLIFSNPLIFATWCCRPLIFQTIISVRLNNLGLKNYRFTPVSYKDIGIRKYKIVTKTQFLLETLKTSHNKILELINLLRVFWLLDSY